MGRPANLKFPEQLPQYYPPLVVPYPVAQVLHKLETKTKRKNLTTSRNEKKRIIEEILAIISTPKGQQAISFLCRCDLTAMEILRDFLGFTDFAPSKYHSEATRIVITLVHQIKAATKVEYYDGHHPGHYPTWFVNTTLEFRKMLRDALLAQNSNYYEALRKYTPLIFSPKAPPHILSAIIRDKIPVSIDKLYKMCELFNWKPEDIIDKLVYYDCCKVIKLKVAEVLSSPPAGLHVIEDQLWIGIDPFYGEYVKGYYGLIAIKNFTDLRLLNALCLLGFEVRYVEGKSCFDSVVWRAKEPTQWPIDPIKWIYSLLEELENKFNFYFIKEPIIVFLPRGDIKDYKKIKEETAKNK